MSKKSEYTKMCNTSGLGSKKGCLDLSINLLLNYSTIKTNMCCSSHMDWFPVKKKILLVN